MLQVSIAIGQKILNVYIYKRENGVIIDQISYGSISANEEIHIS